MPPLTAFGRLSLGIRKTRRNWWSMDGYRSCSTNLFKSLLNIWIRQKSLRLKSSESTTITAEVDISGEGDWCTFNTFKVKGGEVVDYIFPSAFQAYWIRFITQDDAITTAQLTYQ